MAEPTTVLLGNPAPHMQHPVHNTQGEIMGTVGRPAEHINQSVTRVDMQQDFDDEEYVKLTTSTDNDRHLYHIANALPDEHKRYAVGMQQIEHIMDIHAGGAKPTWVSSDDEAFEAAIAAYYGIPRGEPTNLLTNNGRDGLHNQHLGTSVQPASFNYIALTASVITPAAGDTTLTGEITTAGGGLVRAQATYAHTGGTNSSTLTKTFTANGSDSLPVTIAQIGVFNAASAGTLGYHTALSSTATLSVAGDNVTVTETVTGG
jgi:hypothetical protein